MKGAFFCPHPPRLFVPCLSTGIRLVGTKVETVEVQTSAFSANYPQFFISISRFFSPLFKHACICMIMSAAPLRSVKNELVPYFQGLLDGVCRERRYAPRGHCSRAHARNDIPPRAKCGISGEVSVSTHIKGCRDTSAVR